jgi:hypothetical protein
MKLIHVIIALFISQVGICQIELQEKEDEDFNTVFGVAKITGAFLAMDFNKTELNSNDAFLIGGKIGVNINRNFNIGLAGYGLTNNVKSNLTLPDNTPLYIEMGYGGIFMEPVFFPNKVVHLTLPVLVGAGGYNYVENNDIFTNPNWPDNKYRDDPDAFFVAEGGINVEINVFRWLKLSGGPTYRYVDDFENGDFEDQFGGFGGNISLKFGWFR